MEKEELEEYAILNTAILQTALEVLADIVAMQNEIREAIEEIRNPNTPQWRKENDTAFREGNREFKVKTKIFPKIKSSAYNKYRDLLDKRDKKTGNNCRLIIIK